MTIYCRDQVQERQERPHPHAPHPPLCPLYPSALGFSRRKKNKGLAGLFTQCKIELVEVCEEHGSISMGIGRFLSPPPPGLSRTTQSCFWLWQVGIPPVSLLGVKSR